MYDLRVCALYFFGFFFCRRTSLCRTQKELPVVYCSALTSHISIHPHSTIIPMDNTQPSDHPDLDYLLSVPPGSSAPGLPPLPLPGPTLSLPALRDEAGPSDGPSSAPPMMLLSAGMGPSASGPASGLPGSSGASVALGADVLGVENSAAARQRALEEKRARERKRILRNRQLARVSNERRKGRIKAMENELTDARSTVKTLQDSIRCLEAENKQLQTLLQVPSRGGHTGHTPLPPPHGVPMPMPMPPSLSSPHYPRH